MGQIVLFCLYHSLENHGNHGKYGSSTEVATVLEWKKTEVVLVQKY